MSKYDLDKRMGIFNFLSTKTLSKIVRINSPADLKHFRMFEFINATIIDRTENEIILKVRDSIKDPLFFPDDHVDCIRDIVKTSSEIFHKVIDRYVADGQYREAFGFSPELEELIMLETDIPEVFPMARFDFHFDDCDHFSFIEINTDGLQGNHALWNTRRAKPAPAHDLQCSRSRVSQRRKEALQQPLRLPADKASRAMQYSNGNHAETENPWHFKARPDTRPENSGVCNGRNLAAFRGRSHLPERSADLFAGFGFDALVDGGACFLCA